MRTSLAWLNLKHRKTRTIAALTGVAMAIVLIFLQLGFYRAAFTSAVMILKQFSFDVVLVSKEYVYLRQSGSIPRLRLDQARSVKGIRNVSPLYMGVALVQMPGLDAKREVAVIGIDPEDNVWTYKGKQDKLRLLSEVDTVLLDTKVGPGYELLGKGQTIEIDGHRVKIVDDFIHGPGFTGSAALMAGDLTYARIFKLPDRNAVTMGLITLQNGVNPDKIKAELSSFLPRDVKVLTRDELDKGEQNWSINIKPVGIMFSSGLLLAFIVGAVILYQILATEIINHLKEYATLKAMGSSRFTLNMLVWKQAILYAVLGFIPAAILSTLIYAVIDGTTTLPTKMTFGKLITVFILVCLMCVIAGSAAVRKVNRADPADLF